MYTREDDPCSRKPDLLAGAGEQHLVALKFRRPLLRRFWWAHLQTKWKVRTVCLWSEPRGCRGKKDDLQEQRGWRPMSSQLRCSVWPLVWEPDTQTQRLLIKASAVSVTLARGWSEPSKHGGSSTVFYESQGQWFNSSWLVFSTGNTGDNVLDVSAKRKTREATPGRELAGESPRR